YMKQEKFDILLGWNMRNFDMPYLCNRFSDFAEKISPIGQTRYGDGEVFYPAGISIIDYLQWFKKITLNREQEYSLDYIAKKHLKRGKKHMKLNFAELSPEIKERNIDDVKIMIELEKKHKIIPYFDEIRRMAKIEWEDMLWNSRVLDMLLLQEAKNQKVALPMKPDEERGTLSDKEEFAGAFREAFKTGRFFNVGKYDLASCYPSMIIDFCLDPANIDTSGIKNDVNYESIEIEKTMFEQNSNALLPTVTKKLLTLKNDIKKKLSTFALDTVEYKDTKKKYDAIKSVANSAYGVFGNRFFRLYDKRVASATTFLVRDLLNYVITALKSKGYEVIYVDTDGVMINNNTKDISEILNELVRQWAKEKYGKENLTTEFGYEGYYEKILILTKCRYFGYVRTDKGLEEEVKGVEAKRKDSTIFMKKFQRTFIDKILNKEPKEKIFNWIKSQIKDIKNYPLQEISFPCKIGKALDEYKNVPIFVRALKYAQELVPSFKKKVGQLFYYIYVNSEEYEQNKKNILWYDGAKLTPAKLKKEWELHFGEKVLVKDMNKDKQEELIEKLIIEGKVTTQLIETKGKLKNVLAFDEDNKEHIKNIDWQTMINRNVHMKLNTIFESMKWDIKEII
ncbi:MAG TPA: DNA polymerase domain-containing protein, partial [Candidatus Paceibacterota bacterium]|nr:DNA polymerase domain-containing protein [Candidatus Paceibacterota bacterium]